MTRSTANPSTRSTIVRSILLGVALQCSTSACALIPQETSATRGNMAQLLGDEKSYPQDLRVFVQQDETEGLRNRVLNDSLAGLAALELSQPAIAQRLFADARELIETIYANSASAEKARSKFVPEASKDFKGDPYERAMVGYYLSLADFIGNDLDNARADLRFAEYQDTMSSSENYQSDMVLMPYIRGWLYNCSGKSTPALDEFASVSKAKPSLDIPAPKNNVLFIAEVGKAPGKFSTGKFREELRYKRLDDGIIQGVTFSHHNTLLVGQQIEDVYWQASTRGGRALDKVLAGKASFKQTAEDVSVGAAFIADVSNSLSIGAAMAGDDKSAEQYNYLSLLSSLISIASSLVADAAKPEADTRVWSSLPDRIYVTTTYVEKLDGAQWSAGFHNTDGRVMKAVSMKTFTAGSCMVAWARQYPALNESNWADTTRDHQTKALNTCGSQCELVVRQIIKDNLGFPSSAEASYTTTITPPTELWSK
ncbi:MAG: hypothetical protein HOO97_10220 [Sideroxydans sp.]|nr:hypothetical protein [Sideroxydans sp.]